MFKDVVGYEDYFQINEEGEVFSKRSNRILCQNTTPSGYKVISTRIGGRKGKCVLLRIHRLVAEVFVKNPENKPFVNHLDGNKANNSASNLEWCTDSENIRHALNTGLLIPLKGEEKPNVILTEENVREIRKLYVPKIFGKRKIAKLLGLPLGAVQSVITGRSWKHIN